MLGLFLGYPILWRYPILCRYVGDTFLVSNGDIPSGKPTVSELEAMVIELVDLPSSKMLVFHSEPLVYRVNDEWYPSLFLSACLAIFRGVHPQRDLLVNPRKSPNWAVNPLEKRNVPSLSSVYWDLMRYLMGYIMEI